ncbi:MULTISPECIES: TetR/AcrR family transcriptional regulator [Streptomyces]|uniref:TetR/AcrR family transcriptional regulator n=1 Tax=Streptomyces TaxID=1883 RepID=UPI0001D062B2|nr:MULTISPECIES: TetR/AcrR family transcriptional regulator [Streptomyces]MYS42406.1 TetR family transcriptional regulator [Streptomyces sp. SID5998]MYX44964.1 TetR family transcriptional regulator [Streptomyces sp. SID89]NED75926.1 TetR/AcrR family transcriptional regulator [Streptomyces sp. SID9944]EFF88497.1 TetR family transcriptional regulator [Streptomyces sp. e14]MBY8865831.1 TetR/AcrR family transcriptional regulator [Streptomyces sennicomposti]
MANLRQAQKQMTRRLLLESGLELFTTKGYAATTVDDIATAAGTTRVTFYAYFPSRSDLMKTLIDERLNEALQRVRSPEHGSTARDLVATVADGTPEAIGAWLRRTADSWPEIRPIIRAGRDAAAVDPELRDLVERWLEEAVSDIEDGLTRAGRLAPHQRRFRGVLAMAELDYVAQHWGDADWKLDREQMLDELSAGWVRLLT